MSMDSLSKAMENANLTLGQDDRCELFGCLIDAVEDFLTERGITPNHIPNDERDEDSEAIIYGSDYDDLADRFAEVLGINRWAPDESQEQPLQALPDRRS